MNDRFGLSMMVRLNEDGDLLDYLMLLPFCDELLFLLLLLACYFLPELAVAVIVVDLF